MLPILTRASAFVMIILLGVLLRKIGLFKEDAFGVLSSIVIKITLPAAIITSFSKNVIDISMLTLALIGFAGGAIYMLLGFAMNLRKTKEQRAFEVLNLPGYNIGNFALPFTQSFLGPIGVVTTCLFDTGNACICLGTAFSIATMIKDGAGFSWKRLLRALSRSVPFLTYLVVVPLNLMRIQLPSLVLEFAKIIGNANGFLAMFTIGVGFRLKAEKSQAFTILRLLLVRYAVAAVLACICYYLLPFSSEIRWTLVILLFSPIGSAVPTFTRELGGDVGLSSAINSLSIVCSIVIIVAILGIMV